jgi:hypothetical protein
MYARDTYSLSSGRKSIPALNKTAELILISASRDIMLARIRLNPLPKKDNHFL